MTTSDRSIHVFAYGSNLCIERLAARISGFDTVATGRAIGHRLAFHKRSKDGSAKADAFHTGESADAVWGAVYALNEADKKVLDRFEGLGRDYYEAEIDVVLADGAVRSAWIYRATPETICAPHEELRPYEWYHRFCVLGARQHGFPDAYIETMEAIATSIDTDRIRHEREWNTACEES